MSILRTIFFCSWIAHFYVDILVYVNCILYKAAFAHIYNIIVCFPLEVIYFIYCRIVPQDLFILILIIITTFIISLYEAGKFSFVCIASLVFRNGP